jgi:PIN domain nuclease of toxin-antitoxin system
MILLDTHVLVSWVSDPKRIPREATRAIDKALKKDETLGVSAFSIWEIALLAARGRLRSKRDMDVWLEEVEKLPVLAFYPVDNRIARRSVTLPLETNDPADRIIVATALEYGATLITADAKLRAYRGVETVWD